nr:hypothetical protein [Serratia ureilytica]
MDFCPRHHFSCGVLLPGVQVNSIGASLDIAFGISPNVEAALIALLLGASFSVV